MKYVLIACTLLATCNVALHAQEVAKPATVKQVNEAIDFDKIPRLEGAIKYQKHFNHITYHAPGTFKQAADFYLEQLAKLGWQQEKTIPAGDQKDYLSVMFEKDGMLLSLSGYRSEAKDPMTVTLMVYGNVDVRQFPKMGDAEVKSNYKTVSFYLSKKTSDESMAFIRKFMKEQGWTERTEDGYATWAKEGRFVLKFEQNAMECTMVTAKKPDGIEVMYSASVRHELSPDEVTTTVSGKELGKPATLKEAIDVIDIGKLPRMEKGTKGKRDKELYSLPIGTHYEVPESAVDAAATFYRKLLKEQGWTELTPDLEMEDHVHLKFEKNGFLLGFSASYDKKDQATTVALLNHGNVDLRKLPFPPGAKFTSGRSNHINTTTRLGVDEAFEFYRKELTKLGWKEEKQLGQGTMRFTQNGIELRLEIGENIYKKTGVQLSTGLR
ncbi:MAG TPA: hypothetical protein PLN21_12535 [Gemmatales bacterium]|nr:hypothetical protein [Gemmatales bacterium]